MTNQPDYRDKTTGRFLKGRIPKETRDHFVALGKLGAAKRMATEPDFREKCRVNMMKIVANRAGHPEWEEKRKAACNSSQKALACRAAIKEIYEHTKGKALAARAKNPKCQNGPDNYSACVWQIKSPRGKSYIFKNLRYFIRKHKEMFGEDGVWKPKKSGGDTCAAYDGINSIKPYKRNGEPVKRKLNGSWKGWTWISFLEIEHGETDILGR